MEEIATITAAVALLDSVLKLLGVAASITTGIDEIAKELPTVSQTIETWLTNVRAMGAGGPTPEQEAALRAEIAAKQTTFESAAHAVTG